VASIVLLGFANAATRGAGAEKSAFARRSLAEPVS
jgi:hypothetical protein